MRIYLLLAVFLTIQQRSYSFNDLSEFNWSIKDLFLIYLNTMNVSSDCFQAYNRTSNFSTFFDASAKIPSGMERFNFIDIGSYDSCLDIFEEYPKEKEAIYGKYCLSVIPFMSLPTKDIKPRIAGGDAYHMGIHMGYCTPHQCSNLDIEKILNGISKTLNMSIVVQEEYCYTKAEDNPLSVGAIITIVFLAIFGVIVVASSSYDFYLRQTNKKALHEITLAFSLISNGEKLFKTTQNPEQLLCLNGIRAISMWWVIFGHEYSLMMFGGISNWKDFTELMADKANMFLFNAPYSVDSFLMMAGLVTMYTFLKAMDKGTKFNIFLYYLHRYLRLTPAVAILIPIHAFLVPYMGSGPFWGGIDTGYSEACREYWWSSLLYIQNFVNSNAQNCMPQTWYLSVDMQLFLLSPFVLLPSVWYPKYLRYLLGVLIVLGIVVPTVVSYEYNLSSVFAALDIKTMLGQIDFLIYYYFQTHCRFGPYVVGLLFGDLVYQYKKSKRSYLNKKLSICLWIIAHAILWGCLYGTAPLRDMEFDPVPHAIVNGFSRSIWAFGLGIVIYLCVTGNGGFVDAFLSLPVFQLLAKLSYSIYLVHYVLVGIRYAVARDTFHISHAYIMHIFWADFMLSLFLAFLLCVTCESPIIILEKYLLGNGKKAKKTEPADRKSVV